MDLSKRLPTRTATKLCLFPVQYRGESGSQFTHIRHLLAHLKVSRGLVSTLPFYGSQPQRFIKLKDWLYDLGTADV